MTLLLWVMEEDPISAERLGEYGTRGQLDIVNSRVLKTVLRDFYRGLPGDTPFHQPLPDDFPRAQIKMPPDPVAPDYFTRSSFHFVSAKFRQALGSDLIEEQAVQFFPLQSIEGNADAAAQDYHLMYIRAAQPAMDVEKSDCKAEEKISRKTNEPYLHVFDIKRLVLRQAIPAKPELFLVKERASTILVTDPLAQRVLEAGCTGVRFYEPASAFNYLKGVRRYKILEGLGPREK